MSAGTPGRLHVLTPTYRPAGGVLKLMDYAQHARAIGMDVTIWSPQQPDDDAPIFDIERLGGLWDDVERHSRPRLDVGADDLVLMSLPDNYEVASASLPADASPHRIIHLVQGTRHTNTRWRAGYPTRLLTRPASRIAINRIVADGIRPWVDPRGLLRVIDLGHDASYFAKDRTGGLGPGAVVVGYTTWKSDVGDRVAAALVGTGDGEGDGADFEFVAIRETATWAELRELYHRCDVFLSTPEPQEGMYLPGLEAMAAGCLVVTPDVGGNMAYCRPGENCELVGFDDVAGYVGALRGLRGASDEQVAARREHGRATAGAFSLSAEAEQFAGFVAEVRERAHEAERARDAVPHPG